MKSVIKECALRVFHPRRRHYLLVDGAHSCVYIPRHTYRMLNKRLLKSLRKNPEAENSLRFLWLKVARRGNYCLSVNPDDIDMGKTQGLATDTEKRVIIPCPYLQQMFCDYGLAPDFCGRVYIRELRNTKVYEDIKGIGLFKMQF